VTFLGELRPDKQSERIRLDAVGDQASVRHALERDGQLPRPFAQFRRQLAERGFHLVQSEGFEMFPIEVQSVSGVSNRTGWDAVERVPTKLGLSLELLHGLDAAAANRGMLGICADIGFPMPAAFAFLAVGFGHRGEDGFAAAIRQLHL